MSSKVFIIAEAGVNHNGSIELAKKLIDVASESGADAVKFQTFRAEKLVSKNAEKAEYQKNSLEMDFNKNWVNLQNTLEIVKSDTEKITETKEYLARAKESYKYKLITLSDYYKAENDYFEALINSQNDKLNLVYYYITLLAQTNELKKEVKRLKLLLN
jgi:outer membrane protein TolC